MKKAFSLLELIFAIVVLGIISSFAIPKYLDTKDSAVVSTIKRDISTITTSLQTYYLINRKIDKISDALSINESNWQVEDAKLTFFEGSQECLSLTIKEQNGLKVIEQNIKSDIGKICDKLSAEGITFRTYELY